MFFNNVKLFSVVVKYLDRKPARTSVVVKYLDEKPARDALNVIFQYTFTSLMDIHDGDLPHLR